MVRTKQKQKRFKRNEYPEELYKKDLNDLNNHNVVVTHLGPDILECELKCDLGNIARTNVVEVKDFQLSFLKF